MKEKALKSFFEIRKLIIYGKVWAQRTMSWIAIINSAMILFLVLAKLQDYGFNVSITRWFIPVFLLLVILMIFFGYLEDRAGFHREETHELAKKNPINMEILERLERIEKKIEK